MQTSSPLRPVDLHLAGFNVLVRDPSSQSEAHRYCKQSENDFLQCVIFDGEHEGANLIGVEYVISKERYLGLPEAERAYWHPRDHELLSGLLLAPSLTACAELGLIEQQVGTYSKTWRVWHGESELPMGPPELARSAANQEELDPDLVAQRDRRLDISREEAAKERAALAQ